MSKPPNVTGLALPRHWSPEQALAAYELADLLREEIWRLYSPAIQRALRRQQRSQEYRQASLLPGSEPPF